MGKLSDFFLRLVGSRQDSDAINVPFKAKSQCTRILGWLAAGRTLSSWSLISELKATSGASRGREVRAWLRRNGIRVREVTNGIGRTRVKLFWLDEPERKRLHAMLKGSAK